MSFWKSLWNIDVLLRGGGGFTTVLLLDAAEEQHSLLLGETVGLSIPSAHFQKGLLLKFFFDNEPYAGS